MTTPVDRIAMKKMFRYSLLLLLLLLFGSASAAKLYRWVDQDGNVHFSDQVPPEAMQGAHSQLNKQGMTVEKQGAVKSAEQKAREEELERLRKEQQQLVAEQQARDKALLRTFRTEDDIILTRNGKLAAVDSQIQLTQSNIKRLKRTLASMQANAAKLEKQGRKLSKKHRENIAETQRQIEHSYAAILRREQEKQQIVAAYDRDLARFRQLRNLNEEKAPIPKSQPSVFLDTVVICSDTTECERNWSKARSYVQQHTTTAVQVDSERILMTEPPRRNTDLSLTVSRQPLADGSGERIFLDVQCRDTVLGTEFCASERVEKIRQGFKPLLTAP
jgi:hypothetical protein